MALLLVVSMLALGLRPGKLTVAGSDAPQYLQGAYHLAHHQTFTQNITPDYAPPAIGREPGYAVFLAGLMVIDPGFGQYRPACSEAGNSCDPKIFRAASLANLALIGLAGVTMFCVGFLVCGTVWAGVIAGGYLLLNFQMNKGWVDPVSDRLAVFLISLCLLAVAWAWRGERPWRWALVGLALAALTLTKAVFLTYVVLACIAAAGVAIRSARLRRKLGYALAALAVSYGIVVGGWMVRNWSVEGNFRLTDARGGIALSTREVFNHMTAQQYGAAFVYWLRGPGAGLARKLYPADVVEPFDLDRPGGFYDRGQNGYPDRVAEIMTTRGLDAPTASAIVDHQIVAAILERPFTHLATTLPLFWRGIWIDEFIVLGLPLFFWVGVRAVRRGQWLVLMLLSIGAYNLLFYAAFSLNISRYQMTAVPELALAVAVAASELLHRRRYVTPGRHGTSQQQPSALDRHGPPDPGRGHIGGASSP